METANHRPVGSTDSELAFCWLLKQLDDRYVSPPPDMSEVCRFIAQRCDQLRALGVFNMLLTDGEYVLTYCTNHLYWITRRAPFGKATLIDEDVEINFQEETTPNDIVTVIATQPLTANEAWNRMKPGEYNVFHYGELLSTNRDALQQVPFAEDKPGDQSPVTSLR
jgi:glutamine amidotransferase